MVASRFNHTLTRSLLRSRTNSYRTFSYEKMARHDSNNSKSGVTATLLPLSAVSTILVVLTVIEDPALVKNLFRKSERGLREARAKR